MFSYLVLPSDGVRSFFGGYSLQLLLDLGSLTNAVTQVVQLGAAHEAVADHFDGGDGGGVHGEHLFHAHAVGDTTDGEGLLNAAVLLGMTVPSKTWIRSRAPSLTFTCTRTVSPTCTWGTSFSSCSLFSALIRSMDISSCLYRRSCRHVCGVRLVPDTGGRGPPFLRHDRISHPSRFCKHFLRFP